MRISSPSSPSEAAARKNHGVGKAVKPVHRAPPKRTSSHFHAQQPPSPISHESPSQNGEPHNNRSSKRVWKACERCRMKKTKCDGEFPCKRCRDDGLVCTAGLRKKTEYKQLPRGYAEVLENTQFALIATVHKLYNMVRNNQPWEFGEPDINEKGQPVIHNIAAKLGCIRPQGDVDLPVSSFFPEDEAGLLRLAAQLEKEQTAKAIRMMQEEEARRANRNGSPASSDLDTDLEQDYRAAAFGGANSAVTMSPASLNYSDFENMGGPSLPTRPFPSHPSPQQQHQQQHTAAIAAANASAAGMAPEYGWVHQSPATMGYHPTTGVPFIAGPPYMDLDMLNQGLMESNFGTIKPHVLTNPNPEVMLGMGDPMMYSGYDAEALRRM
ncbi:hypothetical protein QBC38DRAFT_272304 [Podospora fimiseda]|uniref:Zn(2)-C6 fungal-type domain-containing protein n=1 Tax=Podospora fimiseda TaxID=252190 RepID=A0AAN7BKT2_9PEZI|nr:hypothetical protein QBC38DRAFT_272304 [Podospora fimiseda]